MNEFIDVNMLNVVDVNQYIGMIGRYLQGPFGIYLTWVMIHYFAAHAYSEYCVNWSLYGLISSPFISTTPICRGLSWIIYEGSNTITHIWLFLGSTMSVYLSKKPLL